MSAFDRPANSPLCWPMQHVWIHRGSTVLTGDSAPADNAQQRRRCCSGEDHLLSSDQSITPSPEANCTGFLPAAREAPRLTDSDGSATADVARWRYDPASVGRLDLSATRDHGVFQRLQPLDSDAVRAQPSAGGRRSVHLNRNIPLIAHPAPG